MQQTDAFQEPRKLFCRSARTRTPSRPLEIEVKDGRCTHAAAVAQIDRDQLFYLMSREVATRLVIEGCVQ